MVHAVWGGRTIVQLVLHGKIVNQDVVNVFNFEAPATHEATILTDADAQADGDALRADWQANAMTTWRACMAAAYTIPRITAQVVERPTLYEHRLAPTEATLTSGNAGTATGVITPIATAGIIRWKSTIAGKSHRGRTYVPMAQPTAANDGLLSSTLATAYAAFAAVMTGARYTGTNPTSGWNFTVYSRPYDVSYYTKRVAGVPTVITLTNYAGNSTNITTSFVDPILRNQRRRQVGVGS